MARIMPQLALLLLSCIGLVCGRVLQDTTLDLMEVVYGREVDRDYIGSPSIVRYNSESILLSVEHFNAGPAPACQNGTIPPPWLSAEDLKSYKPNPPYRFEPIESGPAPHYTYVYESTNNGTDWAMIGQVLNMHFMTIFVHPVDGNVYGMGTTPGGVMVAKSENGGRNWTTSLVVAGLYAGGSNPVLYHNNTMYRALEQTEAHGHWGSEFKAVILSASQDSDIMLNSSWMASDPLPFDPSWINGTQWSDHPWAIPGYLEGNPVNGPDGAVYNVLRVNSSPYANVGCVLRLSADRKTLTYDKLITFPGGMSKFDVKYDPVSNMWFSISNNVTIDYCPSSRNLLTFMASPDMYNWKILKVLLQDDTGFTFADSLRYTGFHYVSFQFDGDSIIYSIRTAYRGAVSYHNSNRITFKTIPNFRHLLQ